ncbi:zinc-ribbon domain-containing protein [Streptomyces sp. NPDC014894]|uniref:zinc-ribbon domain-containing protein n=1 Tax=Streptomyces sp. NPDC014894 TaxID=3364931 RepID=UPI003700122D
MIIFGTKGYLHQLAILTLVCGSCGNPSAHTLRKRVGKFTLFFVPLFAYSTSFATQCTFCGAERKVTREESDRLLAQSAAVPGPTGSPNPAQGFQGGAPYGGRDTSQGGQQGPQGGNPYQR